MRTRALGPDAPAVGVIGFGGMPLSIQERPTDRAEAVRVIHGALDGGVTLIDTANVYCLDDDDLGHNERLIAEALATWTGRRDTVVVATKGGMARPRGAWTRDGRPERLLHACDVSLRALGVERIDLYQLHAPDPKVPFAESVGALGELQRQGKIRWVGLSNVSVPQIEEAARAVTVVTVQNRLSPFFREAVETGVVQHCARQGIGFLAYSPVGGGPAQPEAARPRRAPPDRRAARGVPARRRTRLGARAGSHRDPDPRRSLGGARPGLADRGRHRAEPGRARRDRRRGVRPLVTAPPWPIALDDVRTAAERIAPFLRPTPLRRYATLDEAVGRGIAVLVKHENLQPTNAFKVRNAFAAMTMLSADARRRGVAAATRGNHGQGLAYAGRALGIPVTICAPVGNNPEKNAAMRGFGAELIERGRDYDESLAAAEALVRDRGLTLLHGTNNVHILAGAGTITLEVLDEAPELDAMVIAIGGGSQAVGAMAVLRALRPEARVYAVQAAGAAAIYDSWTAGRPCTTASATTFADGIATRSTYTMTFPALREGLAGFVTVTDAEIAEALRLLLRTTHTLVEGAGAAGLAGLLKLGDALAGQRVGIILSGGNIDHDTLRRVLNGEI